MTSLIVEAAVHAMGVVAERSLRLQQLELLVQKVQRVVARQPADGELVRDFGPLLAVGGHALVQLRRSREDFLQEPKEMTDTLDLTSAIKHLACASACFSHLYIGMAMCSMKLI